MSQQLTAQVDNWIDRTLHDGSGHKIGKIADNYTDDDTGQPEWLAVTTGHFGSNVSLVPLAGATPAGDGIQVPFPKDQVKEAPNAGLDGKLSQEEEARLYAHYGLDYDQERVRLQRWVEHERVPMGTESERELMDGEPRRPLGAPGSVETDDEMRHRHEGTPMSERPVGSSWAHDEEIDDDHQPVAHTRSEPVEVGAEGRRR